MEEHWCIKFRDSYVSLANFIEAGKTKEPYDEIPASFLGAVAMLKRASFDELKTAMFNLVACSSNLDGKPYKNIELMKGFDAEKSGFIFPNKATGGNLSGPFMKSDFIIRFACKRGDGDDAVVIQSEIKTRIILDYMIAKYKGDQKKTAELIDVWYYSTSCLADSVVFFLNHYCLDSVSLADRTLIKSKIPKDCFDKKPIGNVPTMGNVFKLVNNLSSSPIGQSILGAVGVDPTKISHIIGATQDKLKDMDMEKIRTSVTSSAQSGEVDGLGEILMNTFSTFSECIPVVDEGDIDEQD